MKIDAENKKLMVGDILKKARQEQGFTIAEIVRATKIRYSHVEAIENNNYSKLPERTYTLGYISSYSKFLGLNSKEILKQAEIEYTLKDPIYDNMVQNNRLDKKYNPINIIKEHIIDFIFILFSFGFKRYDNKEEQFKHKNFKKSKIPLLLIIIVVLIIIILVGVFALKKTTKITINETPVTLNNKVANEFDIKTLQKDLNKDNNEAKDNTNKIINQEDMVVVNKTPNDNEAEEETTTNALQAQNLNNPTTAPLASSNRTQLVPWPKATNASNITLFFNKDVWVKIYNKDDKKIVYLNAIFKKGNRFKVPDVPNLVMDIGDYKGMYLMVTGKVVYLSSTTSLDVLRGINLDSNNILSKYSTN